MTCSPAGDADHIVGPTGFLSTATDLGAVLELRGGTAACARSAATRARARSIFCAVPSGWVPSGAGSVIC